MDSASGICYYEAKTGQTAGVIAGRPARPPERMSREETAMRFQDTRFSDVKIVLDDSGAFAGVLTADGIEASTADAAFLSDRKVLSGYEQALRSVRKILASQLTLELPRGFSVAVGPADLVIFCTEDCPLEEMDAYLARKRGEVSAAADVWRRERPWDTNPMTLSEARAHNFVFDADTGAIGTDGRVNPSREVELPSSIDGRRVTTIKTACLVSYPYLEKMILPDGVTRMEPYTFYDMIYLKSANIPTGLQSISIGAFARCRSLASVTIPDNIIEICDEAFYQCSSLDTVTIPDSVQKVGQCAFIDVRHILYHGSARGFPWGATVGN